MTYAYQDLLSTYIAEGPAAPRPAWVGVALPAPYLHEPPRQASGASKSVGADSHVDFTVDLTVRVACQDFIGGSEEC